MLDVSQGILIIRGSEKDKGSKSIIHFRDFIRVMDEDQRIEEDKKCSWKHIFILFTMLRPFRLYAQTSKIKLQWIKHI